MANLRNIKRRIKSVGGIRQITRAMEMVSATKLKKAMDRIENARPYFNSMDKIVAHLMASIDPGETEEILHPLMKPGKIGGDTLLVAIGSDKGLCSSFNSNILKFAHKFISDELSGTSTYRFYPFNGELDVTLWDPNGESRQFKATIDSRGFAKPVSEDIILEKAGPYKIDYVYRPSEGSETRGTLFCSVIIDTSSRTPKRKWSPSGDIEIPYSGTLKMSKVLSDINPSGKKVYVLPIGKKIYKPFSKFNNPRIRVMEPELEFDQSLPLSELNRITGFLSDLYIESRITSVFLLYTKYISAARQRPTTEQFLPLGKAGEWEEEFEEEKANRDYIFEPSAEELFQRLIPAYARNKIFQALAHSFTSEHSTRMTAMRNATDNAGEMIDTLTLLRNKARQSAITKELSEIVGGAEALKG